MKNFIVASVLGKSKHNHQQTAEQQQQADQVISKNRLLKGGQSQQPAPLKNVGRRADVHQHQTAAKERPRGKSCDRLVQNRSESHQHFSSEWSDDGGFGQWRAIHHRPACSSRPELYHHHARPISVSITDRIQFVLRQQDRQQQNHQQQQFDNAFQLATNRGFHKQFTTHHYPEYHQHPSANGNGTMGTAGWAYQSGSSSEEAVGPQSLDSQWALQRQQHRHNNQNRVNHPSYPTGASSMVADQQSASALSRKLSTYGTLPRNRQRFFTAKYHNASSSMGESVHNGGQQQQAQGQQQQQQQQQAHQQQQRLRGVTNGDVGTLRPGRLAQPQQQHQQQHHQPAAISSSSALATNGGDSAGGELGSAASSSSQPHSAAHSTHSSGLVLSAPTSLQPGSLAAPQSQQPPHSTAKTDQTDNGEALKRRNNELCTGGGGTLRRAAARSSPSNVDDLIHLAGPLTEDAVLKTLQARFYADEFFTNIGPILLAFNPYNEVGNALTLSSTRNIVQKPQLVRVVQEAVRQQSETGYPQAIILSGCSGSGKTYASMLLLRQLFDVAGGGPETDAFKHLAAAFTVLRSLGSAKTQANSESSRIGHFIEVQVTDGALYRTKIHCYFLDQTRVVRQLAHEKNYHIFYQMLAGLTAEERARLSLEGYSVDNLRYLNRGDTRCNQADDARRFANWKACLGVLGIPFLDVVRVLAAVLLLGNLQFHETNGGGGQCETHEAELKAVAGLLGVTPASLLRGLTMRTHNVRGQLVKSICDANMSGGARDALAKALYCRTVATIVRRANSLKRLCMSGTLSSDSNDSVHNQAEVASQHASTVGTAGSKSSRSMAVLNTAVRHATDGFIGILDMFGFEDPKPSQLEHLCINLCAETMQHFFNTHIFKSSIESCREEGIQCELEPDYVDNVPCIDLISSLRTGLLSMLDVECSARGTPESYVQKVRLQHKHNTRLFEPKSVASDLRVFGIQHFAGRVVYDATDCLDTNRDVLPDDLVSVFYKQSCQFGFATHLFGSELKVLFAQETAPRGIRFRISPTSHTDLLNGDDPVSTLTQDFHTRLDNLLRTLVHAKPHFIRCVRANNTETTGHFDRSVVSRQVRALQVLETVNLMAGGYPHRMRFKAFNARYKMLAPFKRLKRLDDKAVDDCTLILQSFQANTTLQLPKDSNVSTSWSLGKRHIFLSEGARQQLEALRAETRHKAAVAIQSTWRGWHFRRRWPTVKRQLELRMGRNANTSSMSINNAASMQNHQVAGNSHPANRNQQQQPQQQQQLQQQSQQTQPLAGVGQSVGTSQQQQQQQQSYGRPRPQPIACTPPPEALAGLHQEKCDAKTIQHTCSLFGLDLERPPPLPPSRSYTVAGNSKLGYPQTRIMKSTFPEDANGDVVLRGGEAVMVMGASHRRGHLLVEHKNHHFHVPYQFLELKPNSQQPGVDI
ncbi:hypothetical protein GHT06_016716 [Daphnia sinensis]|uniref:Myosin motor domain-containing protein n=1 Tax=Daphnia sinensis TaxID=1820382 RepID=A0AAD5PRN7_9CRUS|nr:hypothetical protein GHT06_016716 [Daphnia sinensis]